MEKRGIRVEYKPLAQLLKLGDDENPKDHDIGGIKASIRRFGFTEPLTLNEHTGRMLAGHGRTLGLEEMREAGEKPPKGIKLIRGGWHVPVLRGISLRDRDEQRAYIVAVNRLVERGGWSMPKFHEMMAGFLLRKVSLDGIGYTAREVERLVARGVKGTAREVPIPKRPEKSRVQLGDIWCLGSHYLACGDTRDASLWARLSKAWGGELAELCMADPPYGMGKGFANAGGQAGQIPNRVVGSAASAPAAQRQRVRLGISRGSLALVVRQARGVHGGAKASTDVQQRSGVG
jgi:hypothetical protein